jgi:hypothetical protein
MDANPDIHHPLFGKLLKEKMDQFGIRCEVYAGREVLSGGESVSIVEFIKQEFAKSQSLTAASRMGRLSCHTVGRETVVPPVGTMVPTYKET